MVLKVVFVVGVALAVAQLTLAYPDLCPDPSVAKELAYKKEIHVEAPLFGRTEKVVSVPTGGKVPSCILFSKDGSQNGQLSITSIGLTQQGDVQIKLVSDIQRGIDEIIEVYTE